MCSEWRAGITARHSTVHRKTPPTKNYPARKASQAEVEKPCISCSYLFGLKQKQTHHFGHVEQDAVVHTCLRMASAWASGVVRNYTPRGEVVERFYEGGQISLESCV